MKLMYTFLLVSFGYVIQAGEPSIIKLDELSSNNAQVGNDDDSRRNFKDYLVIIGKHVFEKGCTITNAYRCSMLPLVGLGLASFWSMQPSFTTEHATIQWILGGTAILLPMCMAGIETLKLLNKKHRNEDELIRMIKEANALAQGDDDSENNEKI